MGKCGNVMLSSCLSHSGSIYQLPYILVPTEVDEVNTAARGAYQVCMCLVHLPIMDSDTMERQDA